jgi:hypothetical protein
LPTVFEVSTPTTVADGSHRLAHALNTTVVIANELPALEQLQAEQEQRDAAIKERADELDKIAADRSRAVGLRLRAARRARCIREAPAPALGFAISDHEAYSMRIAEREIHHHPTPPIVTVRRPVVRRRTCGARRRPGHTRTSSRAGPSESAAPGEPGDHEQLETCTREAAARLPLTRPGWLVESFDGGEIDQTTMHVVEALRKQRGWSREQLAAATATTSAH